ncbi:MAG: MFS transporter [Candidatus Omnitrophica bacterium CG11_big_fil_rev_8_21_14_0_20_45_26]|uniref:MFS transporter n=1 Tax=Candidatus Abzuiibacterium crystallinum TaxID=1974748 RepID=A0A2H0LQS2_9BACT|nr:MAG: MFS transporter [Candidatus Omnitrophica bacterium CG11_big_fil_rev_8_21_14_0_20_45_26]PIW65601.1 MAG: AcrB/AcrD/AcrF family protein [Candidatus Omnitrophica bacterium CG12_big_fil_rev_8_21_14_0_65_45_16]
MKRLITFCVNNSLFVNLAALFFIGAGLMSLIQMGREAFPKVNYDVVTVQTNYFGAPAQEIEKLITIKLEDELKEVDGIDETVSVSTENVSVIVIKLDPDEKDKRKVVNDIQRAVDRTGDLPADLEDDPIVTEIESDNFPVINVSVAADIEEHALQNVARHLETELLDISGVAKVSRLGWRDREIWVEVNPDVVNRDKLSLENVAMALATQNLNSPGGTLDTPDGGEFLVRTMGEFENADGIKKVIIRANDLGNWITVGDVAEVKDTFEDDDRIEKTRGKKTITLTVIKKESGDIIDVVNEVKRVSKAFEAQQDGQVEISFFDDMSYYVKRRLNVLVNNGKVGMVLVVGSLIVFMTKRLALMTAMGIPIALLTTFFLMHTLGLSINLVTMFALIMVLGLIVDDAIVISENVYRHMESGKSPKQAAVDGTMEVALPVISTVLTTIAAFIPLFFMTGIMGKFIRCIPVVVVAALSASLIEALFVLPSHLADFVKPQRRRQHEKSAFDHHFQGFRIRYLRLLRWVIHHRYKALGLVFAIFVGSFILFKVGMRFVLFPQGLIEEFFVRTKAPIGTSLQENEKRMEKIEALIEALPKGELDNYITQVGLTREGFDDPYSNRGSHIGQLHIFLTPEKDRKRHADQIIDQLRKETEPIKDLFDEIEFEKVRAGPPVGKPISIRLRGDSLARLEEVADKVKAELKTIKGTKDIKDDFDPGKKELRVVIDGEKAKKAYLTVRDIATTVKSAIDGYVATTIQKTDEEIDVIVRYPKSYTNSREIFNRLYTPNQYGNLIPINKVAHLEEAAGIQAIKRLDSKRMIQVSGDVDEDVVTPLEVQKKIGKFLNKEIIPHYPEVTVKYGGEQEETQNSFADFQRAFVLAAFLIFIIMACNFNSVIQPLVVMVSIPFGLVGVILAFFLHHQPLSFMAMLGMIGLSGVVVNDSIVLVDFINQHLKMGWTRAHAVFSAGRLRLRPVLLTSISTVVGLAPVAYGIGGSDPFIKPMALAIAWGLFLATALTLLVIPCIYIVADDLKQKTLKRAPQIWSIVLERLKPLWQTVKSKSTALLKR